MPHTIKRTKIFHLSIVAILVGAIVCAGCVQAPINKYVRGDLVTMDEVTGKVALIILGYDEDADEYLLSLAVLDAQGRWTYIVAGEEVREDRAWLEESISHKIGHVDPDNLSPFPVNKYVRGDLVTIAEGNNEVAYIILGYDNDTDKYLIGIMTKDARGRWAHILAELWDERVRTEEELPYKFGHVDPDKLSPQWK